MSKFYTNVAISKNNILYRGVCDGERFQERVPFEPTLYVRSDKESSWSNLKGDNVSPLKFDNISCYNDFIRKYSDTDNGRYLYGDINPMYQFLSSEYKDDVVYSKNVMTVLNFDIETESENGFPKPETADQPIISITCKHNNNITVFATTKWGSYNNNNVSVDYRESESEVEMLLNFMDFYSGIDPDILTGWYIKFFDIPYLINRICNVVDKETVCKFSPWGIIRPRDKTVNGRNNIYYDIIGVSTLDYIDLYQKFTPNKKESYKLDFIAHDELGENKISYADYGSLKDFYKRNWQEFINYNIKDVELVDRLDKKLGFIDIIINVAYIARVNYEDVFSQVKTWDSLCYNDLTKKNIAIPLKGYKEKESYVGGFVKAPIPNLYKWVVSFDLNSLYPHLMIQYNISPDTLVKLNMVSSLSIDGLVDKSCDLSMVDGKNVTVTANGSCYKRDRQGFLPSLVENIYNKRVEYKKMCSQAKKDGDVNKESVYDNLQLAMKILINSAYGATGCHYFRYYDIVLAEAVTTSGQVAIRWIERKLNLWFNKNLKTENIDYIVAIDTDSVYINMETVVLKYMGDASPKSEIVDWLDNFCKSSVTRYINKCYAELSEYTYAYKNAMEMKREKIADTAFWTAKKRYAMNVLDSEGYRYANPDIKIVGIETSRSTTPECVRTMLLEDIRIVLQEDENSLRKHVSDVKKVFYNAVAEDISFPTSVNNMEKYTNRNTIYSKGCPIHVRGSLLYNHYIKEMGLGKKYELIKEGDKVKYVYLETPNPVKENVIAFIHNIPEEFNVRKYVNYDMQYNRAFVDPLTKILSVLDWTMKKTNTIDM